MDMQRLRIGDEAENADVDNMIASDTDEQQSSANNVDEQAIHSFCSEVVDQIKTEGILATPLNYQIYFERHLETKNEAVKDAVFSLIDSERDAGYDNYIDLERHLRTSFRSMKQILEVVAVIYKNQSLFHEILDKRVVELKKVDNPVISHNIVQGLIAEINRLKEITHRQSDKLKDLYQQSADVINSVDSNTVFDQQYGIYNSHFITTQVEKETKIIDQSYRSSTLLMVKLIDNVAKEVSDSKALLMIQRSVADMLLKTSRRSDIIAHYKDGIFAILLRHSDLQNAQVVCKRLFVLVKSSNTFIDNKRITLEINIAVAPLKKNQDVEALFNSAITALLELNDQHSAFKVVGG